MTLALTMALLIAANPGAASDQVATAKPTKTSNLGAEALASGREADAIVALEQLRENNPADPALLINLGIAYAHRGDEDRAQQMFEAALSSRDVIELETASGSITDSRRLARKALTMLARGEFKK
ncbi:MAG: tetratricopeptide repeat protein [Pseudomonadota bacterium]